MEYTESQSPCYWVMPREHHRVGFAHYKLESASRRICRPDLRNFITIQDYTSVASADSSTGERIFVTLGTKSVIPMKRARSTAAPTMVVVIPHAS